MPTVYRACVITNSVRTQGLLSPQITREFGRDSKAALAECRSAFLKLLADNIPSSGARAWFERTDARGHTVTLARYSGAPTGRDRTTGRETSGRWMLEEWAEEGDWLGDGDGLPDFVDAGTQRGGL